MRRVGRLVKDVAGAVLLAFGAIFQPKNRPDDHWSERPGVEAVEAGEAEASGPR